MIRNECLSKAYLVKLCSAKSNHMDIFDVLSVTFCALMDSRSAGTLWTLMANDFSYFLPDMD
jgi:hypothetical protein